jgi:hypothetical protein
MTFAKVSNTVFLIYHPFKEDRFWHSWHRHLLTTARSHNVDNVLNLTYSPVTLEDTALLAEQQRFVFSVLEQKVLTSDGIVFIRIHSDTGDATAVYSKLVKNYSKSTAAQLAASEIEEDLSTFPLDDTWKQTNLMFLNTFWFLFKIPMIPRRRYGSPGLWHPSSCYPCPPLSLRLQRNLLPLPLVLNTTRHPSLHCLTMSRMMLFVFTKLSDTSRLPFVVPMKL